MHLSTERHAATSLLVSAIQSDYRRVLSGLNGRIPVANAVSSASYDDAEVWLTEHVPQGVLWRIGSHLAFWDHPEEFNPRLVEFLTGCDR